MKGVLRWRDLNQVKSSATDMDFESSAVPKKKERKSF